MHSSESIISSELENSEFSTKMVASRFIDRIEPFFFGIFCLMQVFFCKRSDPYDGFNFSYEVKNTTTVSATTTKKR